MRPGRSLEDFLLEVCVLNLEGFGSDLRLSTNNMYTIFFA